MLCRFICLNIIFPPDTNLNPMERFCCMGTQARPSAKMPWKESYGTWLEFSRLSIDAQ